MRKTTLAVVQLDKLSRINCPIISKYKNWILYQIGLMFRLPNELINIIKEYCFQSIEQYCIRQWKQYCINEINEICYSHYDEDDETVVRFMVNYGDTEISGEKYWIQMQPYICVNCGNYVDRYRIENYNESCRCHC